jgi:hypothetical protein
MNDAQQRVLNAKDSRLAKLRADRWRAYEQGRPELVDKLTAEIDQVLDQRLEVTSSSTA